jgi:hypothetical protein
MAKIIGDGIDLTARYKAKPAMANGLFWLEKLPRPPQDEFNGDWAVKIDENLARAVRGRFGGSDLTFRQAVEEALKKALSDV